MRNTAHSSSVGADGRLMRFLAMKWPISVPNSPGDSLEENLVSSGCGTRTRNTDIKSVKIKRLQKTVLSHYALSQVDGSGFVFGVRNT